MASETLKIDSNNKPVTGFVTDDANQFIRNARLDDATKGLKVMLVGGTGSGTVTSVSVVSANGFAGTVATPTTTPAITLTTSITGLLQGNGTALSAVTIGSGLSFVGGTLSATGSTLTVGTSVISGGTNTRVLFDNSGVLGEYTISGSGSVAMTTSPTFVTPTLGAATATTINKLTLTQPATGSTLTIADGKTLTVSNTLTFTGTDTSSVAFGTGGTVAYTANNLSVFAATTSAQLAGVISDETGSGALVFGTNPTIAKPIMNARNQTAQTYSPGAGGTATLDLSLADQHYITMPAGNITIALSNDTNNQVFYVTITQDGTGSRTVTWFTTIKWAGGVAPVLTTTASKRDAFMFVRTGSSTYDGFVVGLNI